MRHAIELGIDPITAIQMCTINPAEAYRVDDQVGILAPGRTADVVLVKDLTAFRVDSVIANGEIVVKGGALVAPFVSVVYPEYFHRTMHRSRPITEADIYRTVAVEARQARVVVMNIELSQIRTKREVVLPVQEGLVLPDPGQDAIYVSVTDRHSGEAKTASAFIGGFGLKRGAIATSLSPDDDNVICVGASVRDMVVAINHLFDIGGGQVVASGGQVTHELALPVAGIMADIPVEEMAVQGARATPGGAGSRSQYPAQALLRPAVPVNHGDPGMLRNRSGFRGLCDAILHQPNTVMDLRRLDRTSSGVGRRTDLMVAILPDVCLLIRPMTTPVASDRLHSFESSYGDCS